MLTAIHKISEQQQMWNEMGSEFMVNDTKAATNWMLSREKKVISYMGGTAFSLFPHVGCDYNNIRIVI